MRYGEQGCVVALHRELNAGTLAGVLKQAKVSGEDFADAFRT
jgi:hypothetical protein